MKKLIDFDGIFDNKLTEYMEENAGKYTERQWESLIPKLYKNFGDTFLKIAGNTPNGYYSEMSDEELIETLAAHIREDVPISDFLCREIERRDCPEQLKSLLLEGDERIVTLAVNLAGDNPKAFDAYFALLRKEIDAEVKDAVVEQLKSRADVAKALALQYYEEGIERQFMLEILSRCKEREDRIFEILLREYRASGENLPIYASFLASYGDERALPELMKDIDREDINFLEFQELKYAIEALGGEYTRERDFSGDPYFREIAAQSQILPDFTGNEGNENKMS